VSKFAKGEEPVQVRFGVSAINLENMELEDVVDFEAARHLVVVAH